MTKAEQFCKLNGIHCHEYKQDENLVYRCTCGYKTYFPTKLENPTFTDAKSILEVMMKRKDFYRFIAQTNQLSLDEDGDLINNALGIDYILNPDKLLDEAIKFCEEKK